MAHLRTSVRLLLLATAWLWLASSSTARDEEFKIIVHPDNPVSVVDQQFVRDAFLKKATSWSHGGTIRPIGLSAELPARDAFLQEVLKKTPAQLRSYWVQRIFSGTGVPPPEAESTAAAISYVLANPGALGYLPSHVDPGRAKVVTLR